MESRRMNATGNERFEGYIPDLLKLLSKHVGFRYRLGIVRDGQYGNRRPDDSWNGMIGEILRRQSYMAASPLFVTEQRARVVDFTMPFLDVQATILIKKQEEGKSLPFSTARDLIYQDEYQYGTLNRGVIKRALSIANDTVYKTMRHQMRFFDPSAFTATNAEGIERVRKEKYAYVLPNVIADYISRRKPCDLLTVDSFLIKRGYSIAIRKGSALVPRINRAIAALKSQGYLERLYYKWWIRGGDCNGKEHTKRYYSLSKTNLESGVKINYPGTLECVLLSLVGLSVSNFI